MTSRADLVTQLVLFALSTSLSGCQECAGSCGLHQDLCQPSTFEEVILSSNQIPDCGCSKDAISHFNSLDVHPRIQALLARDYFRYYRVNFQRPCPFWDDPNMSCGLRDCSVQACAEEDVPQGLLQDCEDLLGAVDPAIGESESADLRMWMEHDREQERFCDIGDEEIERGVFVDLLKNPERFTGYRGDAAHRIWRGIYRENCFFKSGDSLDLSSTNPFSASDTENLCLEERIFYRAISGLHASINVHLSANYPTTSGRPTSLASMLGEEPVWGFNLDEFLTRFSANRTKGRGPGYLDNLFFLYLLELRAVTKAEYLLRNNHFFTGYASLDKETGLAVEELLDVVQAFPDHFNEEVLFASKDAARLRHEFRQHFLNVTRIMDCVGCERCKLWGKLQTQGLGTALKILFASPSDLRRMQLSRNEIVALFNAFGRLSNSIQYVQEAQQILGATSSKCSETPTLRSPSRR
ncbi:unnamed protein product [Cyprideis torosa]|uniref:Uncharacterized protein n=1 Tax=Cyprideis torosa TaxID=163714 RepID=A0A7R8W354_9CRUS|nr:unnamed protein product [Cyprideis torosa]CAG0882682.1 unnamed protein product [Cyprideis torosa]